MLEAYPKSKHPVNLATHPTQSIIFLVVCRLLNVVSSNNSRISMIVVAGIRSKVDLSKELLLMVLEFAYHFALDFFSFLDYLPILRG
jgi:hypothetical protein